MADIGLNQSVTVGSREFHIQTSTHVEDGYIRSEIFEKGSILYTEVYRYEKRKQLDLKDGEKRLRKSVENFHHSIIEVLYSLFEISRKLLHTSNSAAHEKLGLVFLHMHIFDKAEQHFLMAIDNDPERFSSYIYLAKCYYFLRKYNQAYELLTNAMKNKIHYPDMYNLMGLIMMANKKFVNAFNHFKEAIKLNPNYTEAYFNLARAILLRISYLKSQNREKDVEQNLNFFGLILKKIEKIGSVTDRKAVSQVLQTLRKSGINKTLSLMDDYLDKHYVRKIPPEVVGYEFYLRLCYSDEEMSLDVLKSYEEKIAAALEEHPTFPDLWNYSALIYLMQCRFYFLQGLDNFRESTRINPQFEKARKNLRLVENDGREFLSLIKAIV